MEPEIVADEPMSRHTTFGIGGPADLFARPKTVEQLLWLVDYARRVGLPFRVIGRGSNLLVRDSGIRGLVIHTRGLDSLDAREDGLVIAECGVSLPKLSLKCARLGLTGMEFALGVPGSVGGAVRMNAGCYGQNMGKVVEEVRVLDDRGEAVALPVGQLGFAYRHSRIKGSGDIVLSAGLRLEPGHDPAQIEAETRALFGKKRVSQPIGERCAGSVFLSPPGESASRMIDEAGLKGTRCGGAVVSMKHAGFIVNDRGASADDVLRLIDVVRDRVGREFGVSLDLEVEVVGDA